QLEASAPRSVEHVLGYPSVGGWMWRQLRSSTSMDPGLLGTLALAAAVNAGIACQVELPIHGSSLVFPSLGLAVLPANVGGTVTASVRPDTRGGAILTIAPKESESVNIHLKVGQDTPHWQALRDISLSAGFTLTIDDLDPFRWPMTGSLRSRLPAEVRDRWTATVTAAWDLIVAAHPGLAAEIMAAVRVVVPLKTPAQGSKSATAREVFGTIAMSEPPDPLTVASTFAHELQHAKLTALLDLVQLTVVPHQDLYYAPWRDDPRPVYGLLQGTYAFLGLTSFWRRQRLIEPISEQARAHTEFARWREAAYAATASLLDGKGLTPAGRDFVSVIRSTLEEWLTEPVPAAALNQARAAAIRHRREWRARINQKPVP
ncbi:HEXXH motif domain-containing protein, partial [Acrocarpospora pleiomorpha]